ncbi:murein L,D-transpeptidase catalytic domain family protein [Longimicrobium sp.]|uniref:murein L,D-transpeptidase catalytic domain family protein n=1 Tax=Longimicrobium sp. TaxID=2029185 RepID=UPI002CE0F689|nr:murein L,D-transpeptidase catalytic domain family protein [Longimicrobium sp.]HSU17308.1 murein L,D-transpeptidase catalytic domain family protein [Longimicrobium sp.]
MEILPDPLDQLDGGDLEGESVESLAAAAQLPEQFPAAAVGITEIAATPFAHLDPDRVVPQNLLAEALAFFQAHKEKFSNTGHISVLDYSLRSSEPRFHVIDMQTGQVQSFRMANGVGSEPAHDGFAHKFSNVPGSNMSSLGFVRTAETYQGKHGFSLRLDGLSDTNSKMRTRAVVVHGADYVHDKPVIQGRSNGCPALPMDQRTKVINLIKEGSLMYFARSQA